MPGEMITIYATGLGIVGPDAAKNALQTGVAYTGIAANNPISSVSSLAGGKTANVISAGLSQGSIGIYEVVLELNSSLAEQPAHAADDRPGHLHEQHRDDSGSGRHAARELTQRVAHLPDAATRTTVSDVPSRVRSRGMA